MSRSSPVTTTPGARRARRARPAWHPFGRWCPDRVVVGFGEPELLKRRVAEVGKTGSGRVVGVAGRRSWIPAALGNGADPRPSRRRGPGEDSTGQTAVARRF